MKNYFGLAWPIGIVLQIFFGFILSFASRFSRGNFISAVLALLMFFIFWPVDIVSIIVNKDIKWLDF